MQNPANCYRPAPWRRPVLTKTLLVMKLTLLLLSAAILNVHAAGLSQTITLSGKNLSLPKIFSAIEQQTGYVVWGKLEDLEQARPVSLSVRNMPLTSFLDKVLEDQPLHYRIADRTIMLFHNSRDVQAPTVSTAAQPEAPAPPPARGRVTDASGAPLAGINILIKGTGTGTTTDANGNFEINTEPGSTLVISGVGYETAEIRWTGSASLAVTLQISENKLDEVVVIGYGTERKIDLTGAVGSVNAERLEKRPVTNIDQALSGAITGVDVSTNSGKPGGSPQIRVRGTTSVSNTNDPLYVVDGIMLNMERILGGVHPINSIDPNNIQSIEVLKDASATAIYGARGANGVILITTKKGRKDGGRAAYQGTVSMGSVAKRLDLMNAREFLLIEDIAYQNAEKFDPDGFARGNYIDPQVKRSQFVEGNPFGNPVLFDNNLNPLYDTDWQDAAFRNAFTQNHNLSFSGGDSKTSYGIYLNYRDEDGVLKESWLNRYSGRFVINSQINDWLSVGGSLNYNNQKERVQGGWALRSVYQNIPVIPVKFPDGSWAKGEVYPGVEGPNQQQVAVGDKQIYDTRNVVASVSATADLSKSFSFKTMVGTNQINQDMNRYAGRNVDWVSQNQGGIASLAQLSQQSWQFENLLNYNPTLGGAHSVKAMLGQSMQTFRRFSSQAETWGFLDDYYEYNNLGVGNNPRPSSSSSGDYSMLSYFGRANYSYDGKYLLTITGRIDGSSKFGQNNRYAFFPSAAVGWLVSEEEFMKSSDVISYLKIRSSYGLTGNSEIANYQYEAGLGSYTTIFNGTRNIGIGISTLSNSDLKWETNTQIDAGIEIGFLNNRIRLEADVYHRKSKDMLLSRPVPRSSGYGSVVENIGNMQNEGIELALNTQNISRGDFRWSTLINFSTNKNKVLKLHGGADILIGSVPGGAPGSIIREGLPINTFVGYVRLGTWGSHEATEAARYNRKPGDVKYQDINDDGTINSQDRIPIGNGVPKGYGSFINTFSYGNFELSIDIQFMYGNDVMWEANQAIEDRTGAYNNMLRTVLNAWTPDNQQTFIAQNKPLRVGYDTNNDTYRLKDGSFIRGRNLSLSYSLPQRLLEPRKIHSLRFFANAQNFFLATRFPGFDPEVSTPGGDFSRGRAAYYEYPSARILSLGVNIEF